MKFHSKPLEEHDEVPLADDGRWEERVAHWKQREQGPERAADGPFGGTIAHGLLTLSLLPRFMHQLYTVGNITMAINYGYNKVRFITPVKVGAKVRARAELSKVDQLDGAVQSTMTTTVEIEGSEKPAAVAESIVRYIR